MKKMNQLLSLLLCFMMLLSMMPMRAHAAGGQTNVSASVSVTEAEVGGTFTVTLSNGAMTVSSFTAGISFDTSKLECLSIVGPYASMGPDYERFFFLTKANVPSMMATASTDVVSTVAEANAAGAVGRVAGTVLFSLFPLLPILRGSPGK